jgi:pimeloyl-ACP methyl ester carboxylesterase
MDTDRLVMLPDGSLVSYRDVGSATGRPILYLHGTPSSRMEASGHFCDMAAELGLRVLAPDRPGYGRTTFTRYAVRNYPRQLVGLLEELNVGEIGIVGVSGGGRYACACAASLGSRVNRLALVASTAPSNLEGVRETWSRQDRQLYLLAIHAPWLLRSLLAMMAHRIHSDPQRVPELFNDLPVEDQAVLDRPDVRQLLAATMTEAFRQGTRGAVHDIGLEAQPWDVDLAAIASAVELWHGRKDTLVPIAQGETLAREIPNATTHLVADEGHISLRVNAIASILQTFV